MRKIVIAGIMLVSLILGYSLGRASIRMVDDPKNVPQVMKLKNLRDGTVHWEPQDDTRTFDIGDVITKTPTATDSSQVWVAPQYLVVVMVKDAK